MSTQFNIEERSNEVLNFFKDKKVLNFNIMFLEEKTIVAGDGRSCWASIILPRIQIPNIVIFSFCLHGTSCIQRKGKKEEYKGKKEKHKSPEQTNRSPNFLEGRNKAMTKEAYNLQNLK